ncbi:MAG: hypothetical protein HYW56_00030 [Candidatus Harrisonbacteria bacterium]|nr:hypothetical protein [Candidatus Harrisonbacteria bacterium]MBI2603917.1 hypothetical protein [Candidatus Harrisonbacteria bacterium]
MLNDRAGRILEAVIREFVEDGAPVSSDELYNDYNFGIKPASIRAELLRLTNAGFLEQPHTSGGRVPTERAYRFWVDGLVDDLFADIAELGALAVARAHYATLGADVPSAVEAVAGALRLLGAGYAEGESEVSKTGLDELCHRMDFQTREDFLEVVHDFERLDDSVRRFASHAGLGSTPKVYIGESPLTRSPHLSVVAARYSAGGVPAVVIAIGPKRMDYKKALKVFKELPAGKRKKEVRHKK